MPLPMGIEGPLRGSWAKDCSGSCALGDDWLLSGIGISLTAFRRSIQSEDARVAEGSSRPIRLLANIAPETARNQHIREEVNSQ